MRKILDILILFLLFNQPLLAYGEIYKFIDKDGVEHYSTTPPSRPQIASNEPLVPETLSKIGGLSILEASEAQIELIQSALGDNYPIIDAAIVKSKNHGKGYYIGAFFEAQGIDPVLGIWLIGDDWQKPPPLCLSVNGAAFHFSGVIRARETKAAAYVTDPEAKALREYFGE